MILKSIKMYSGYIDSNFVLQNHRCWQVMLNKANLKDRHG
jgi:hypothetical protein